MHKKISEMPKEWPLARKGKKYIAVASHNDKKGIPVLFILRDILKIATTKREARKLCLAKDVKVNGKIRADVLFPLLPRDILSLDKMNKHYVLKIKNKKFDLEEVKDAKTKIVKVLDKKLLGKDKIQANLDDGTNLLIKDKFSCGDSLLLDLEKNKVMKVIPLKKGAKVEVISGKHIGEFGKVDNILKEGDKTVYEINIDGGESVFLVRKTLLAIE